MTDAELKILLSAKDDASHTIKGMRGELEKVASTAKDVAVGFAAATVGMSVISSGGMALGRAFAGITDSIFGMNATLETANLQFKTLMGSASLAKEHVAMLFQIAKETPFETGPIIAASQALEAFGGGALNTQKNIIMIGDAAAATGSGIEELGFWVGRLYSSLSAGKPFGEAAQRLQELKVLTPEARNAMEKLQDTGGSTAAAWEILTTSFKKFEGGMKEQATTWTGLVSTFTDGANMLIAAAFKPIFEEAKTALSGINDFIDENGEQWSADMSEAVKAVIEALGGVPDSADPVGEFLTALPKMIKDTAEPMKQFIQDVKDLTERIKTLLGITGGVGDFFAALGGGGKSRGSGTGFRDLMDGMESGSGTPNPPPEMIKPPWNPLQTEQEYQQQLDQAQADAEAALGAAESARAAKLASAQAARADAATALENARNAGKGLTGNFGSDEASLKKAQAEAAAAAREWERTKPITLDLFGAAFAHGGGADLGVGRGAFDAMRKVIEEGGQQNIDALGKVAADMAQTMRSSGMTPAEAEAWVGSFMDTINVAIVTKSVDAAHNVGELVKLFDIEKQMQDAGRKAADAVNEAIDQTAEAINDAQSKASSAVDKLKEDFNFSQAIKADMDKLNEALRVGMKAMADTMAEAQRNTASQREMIDIGTQISRDNASLTRGRAREDLTGQINRQRAVEDLTQAHNKRLADINKAGGPGAAAAIAAENQQFSEQQQQMAKQESRAQDDRQRARADQDADRALALQLGAEDRALRDARAASDRETLSMNEKTLAVERARLELPIQQLEKGVAIHGLNQQIADVYKTQEETIGRANAALAEKIKLTERELQLTKERLGIMSSAGESDGPTSNTGFGAVGTGFPGVQVTIQNDGFIGEEDIAAQLEGAITERVMARTRASG